MADPFSFSSLLLSFFTGLLAALNPCTAPLYPIVFSYYLTKEGKRNIKNILLFLGGFLGAFIILAGILLLIGDSGNFQEAVRFIAAGVVALLGVQFILRGFHIPRALEQKLRNIDNPFLFGAVFGLALNPCSLPLFITNLAITSVNAFSFLNILFFGVGVAIPPVLAGIFGAALIKKIAFRVKGAYQYLEKIVGIFLIIAAVFIITMVAATPVVAVISSVFILLFFVLLVAPFWKKILRAHTHQTALWTLSGFLFLLWGIITFHCYQVSFSTHYACGVTCGPCRLCTALLLGVLIVGFAGFHLLEKQSKAREQAGNGL